jgi:ParB family chromosome partitioning protein
MQLENIPATLIAEVEGFNPRSQTAIDEHLKLVSSIKEIGLQQPPIVRKDEGGFKLVAGHRRFKAALDAGLTEIPCLVREDSLDDSLVISMAENVNRVDLDPVDEAGGFKRMRAGGLTNKGIAAKVGVPEKLVTERIRILELPDEVQEMIRDKKDAFPLSCVKQLVAVAEKHAGLAIVCAEAVAGGRYSPREFAKDPVPLLAQFRASRSYPAFAVGQNYERAVFMLSEEGDAAGTEADELVGYPVGVRFNQEELDRALGAGVAILGKSTGQGAILDWEYASELASQKLVEFVADWKAKRQESGQEAEAEGFSMSSRVFDKEAGKYTEDPERATEIRKEQFAERQQEQAEAHAFNMRLGTELVQKFDRIEPTLQVLKAISAVGLRDARDLAARGMRYCYPAWVEEESKRLKDGRVKTKIVYKEVSACTEAVTTFLEGARTTEQYAGRVMILLLANRYADEKAIAMSSRGGSQPHGGNLAPGNWNALAASLDAIAKRKLSGSLYEEALERYERSQRPWASTSESDQGEGPTDADEAPPADEPDESDEQEPSEEE